MDYKKLRKKILIMFLFVISVFAFPTNKVKADQWGSNGSSGAYATRGFNVGGGHYVIVSTNSWNDQYGPIRTFTDKYSTTYGAGFWTRHSALPKGVKTDEEFRRKCGSSDWVIAAAPADSNWGRDPFYHAGAYPSGTGLWPGSDAILTWKGLRAISNSSSSTAKKVVRDLKANGSFFGKRVNLLCSFQVKPQLPEKTVNANMCKSSDNKAGKWKKVDNKQFSIKGTTKYQVIVEPVVPGNLNTLESKDIAKWRETHKTQRSKVQKTEFGKYLDKINKDGTLKRLKSSDYEKSKAEFEKVKKTAQELIKKDEENLKNLSMEMDFSNANQEGLTSGGAYTISLETSETWLKVNTAKEQRIPEDCVNTDKPVSTRTVCYNKSGKVVSCSSTNATKKEKILKYGKKWVPNYSKKQERTKTSSVSLKILFDRGFHHRRSYQIVNVVCNVDKLKEIISSIEGEILSTGKHNNTITMLAKTKIKEGGDQKANWLTPRNMTADFFYGGDCDERIYCTSKPEKALTESDGKTNKQNENALTVKDKTLFGAQTEDKNTSFFQFFRDGDKKVVRNDVWTIATDDKNNGLILPKKASSTDIGIWGDSTPDPIKKSGESLLSVYVNGKEVDWNKGKKIKDSKQYRLRFPGEQNKIEVASSWASEGKTDKYPDGRPVKMLSSYYYKPKVSSNTLSKVNINGNIQPVHSEEVITSVCDMYYNTLAEGNNIQPTHGLIPENGKFFPGRMNIMYGDFTNGRDLTINFVKSSRE